MIIQKYKIKGAMLHVTTDEGEFVYFKDKFKNLDSLKQEIEKKIALTTKMTEKKELKLSTVVADMKKENIEKEEEEPNNGPDIPPEPPGPEEPPDLLSQLIGINEKLALLLEANATPIEPEIPEVEE